MDHAFCDIFARYQINARTELAVRYNDISPLENHHCAVAFQILALPECNIFANVDPETFKQIRQVSPHIHQCALCTSALFQAKRLEEILC